MLAKTTFDIVQSHERIAGCDIFRAGDGTSSLVYAKRQKILPRWKSDVGYFGDRYPPLLMNAEQQM